MTEEEEKVVENIIEALSSICPVEEISDYHKASIEKLVNHFKGYGDNKGLRSIAFFLSFTEDIQVDEVRTDGTKDVAGSEIVAWKVIG